ncbi:MoaD/ThiS family protein [Dongia rigui]|uniref:MoaD/ThiS family protein n=1 Tax=Dongia rigui TaxID=940149 RepID=A0ABU5E171_9PROT|nr:MoaD/ThiS family protein [Dongia rigui]MDY0873296.1 MoaD/ThiS family protein [Dongia rigui]
MAKISFTAHLRKVAPAGATHVAAATLGCALSEIFAQAPKLRGYVVDEQDRLRRHVVIFVNGSRLAPSGWAECALQPDDEVYVMQALSGG